MEVPSNGLRKGAWTSEEDGLLKLCVDNYGEGKWHQVPLRAGLNRCRKSCRLRWLNYLTPSIKRGNFNSDEVDLLLRLHKLLGNRWSLIAGRLPGRTANDVKNYWNTHLGKKHEPCCKDKMKKKNITCSPTTSVPKIDVLKPRPRSFMVTNGCGRLNGLSEVDIGDVSNNDVSITSNKDDEECEFVNILNDGESMWWESLLEESQEVDVVGSSLINSMSPRFNVEQPWSLIMNEDTGEIEIQKNL